VAGGDLVLRAEARAARYDQYLGLDHAALGAGASWRRKLGLGLTAPWLAFDSGLLEERYSEPGRAGHRAALSLELGKRFGPRVDAALVAAYDWREQRDEEGPFSLQGRS